MQDSDLKKTVAKLTRKCTIQQKKLKNLKDLIRINKIINSASLDEAKLLKNIMKTAENVMQAQASSLMMIDKETNELVYKVALGSKGKYIKERFRLKMGQGVSGWVAQNEKPLVVPDVTKDDRFYSKPDEASGFVSRSIICVPLKMHNKTIGILQAINPINKKSFSKRDIPLFTAFAEQVAVAIDNVKVHNYRMTEQRLQSELEVAKTIQTNLLPRKMPSIKGLQFAATNISARSVGGDLFDFVFFKGNRVGVVIGDVSGKGIPAALFMVATITNLRFLANTTDDPATILTKVNRLLFKESSFGMFVTVVLMLFDLDKKSVTYANAGHIPPILVNKNKKVKELGRAKSPPIGIIKDMKYYQQEIPLKDGDTFLMYTDGITEARNSHKTEYGTKRLIGTIRKTDFDSPKQLIDSVYQSVKIFSNGKQQHDDITLVSVGY